MSNSLYIAVASLVIPLIAAVVMWLYPALRVFGWITIAICSALFLGATALFVVAKFPQYFTVSGLQNYLAATAAIAGLLLVLSAMLYLEFGDRRTAVQETQPAAIKTGIRLQFFGGYRIPTEASRDNVAAWFAYFSPSLSIVPKDAQGKIMVGGMEIPPSWVIFLSLDKPASSIDTSR